MEKSFFWNWSSSCIRVYVYCRRTYDFNWRFLRRFLHIWFYFVAGLLIVLLSAFLGKLVKFFPPLVTGSVVTIIGITLIPVAIKDLAGGEGSKDFGSLSNLGLGFGVLLLIIVLYRFTKGFMRSVSVLLGLVVGTIAASFMGKVDFSGVKEEAWVHMPHVLYFGMPTFNIMAILTMFLVLLVGIVEST